MLSILSSFKAKQKMEKGRTHSIRRRQIQGTILCIRRLIENIIFREYTSNVIWKPKAVVWLVVGDGEVGKVPGLDMGGLMFRSIDIARMIRIRKIR